MISSLINLFVRVDKEFYENPLRIFNNIDQLETCSSYSTESSHLLVLVRSVTKSPGHFQTVCSVVYRKKVHTNAGTDLFKLRTGAP